MNIFTGFFNFKNLEASYLDKNSFSGWSAEAKS